MFCIYCGTKLADGAKFCFNCGNKVASAEEVAAPIVEAVVTEPVIEQVEEVIEEPVIEQVEEVIEEPVMEQPVVTPIVVEQPIFEQPVVEQPVVEQPVVEHPVVEQPVYQQPVVEQPAYQQPVYQQPVVEQPVYQQPEPQPKKAKKKKKHTGLKVFFILLILLLLGAGTIIGLTSFNVIDLPLPSAVSKYVNYYDDLYNAGIISKSELKEEEEEAFTDLLQLWDASIAEGNESKFEKAFPSYAEDYILESYNAKSVSALLSGLKQRDYDPCGEKIELSESHHIYKKIKSSKLDDYSKIIKKLTGEKVDITKAYIIEGITFVEGDKAEKKYSDYYFFYEVDEEWYILPISGEDARKDFKID